MMKRIRSNEKGFTLIELIIVIAILAVIAAIAVPNIMSAVSNGRKTTDVTNAKMLANAAATVTARDDRFGNVSGVYTTTGAGVLTASGTGVQNFADEVVVELNNAVPLPKYKGGTAAGASAFVMTIAADNSITIVTSATSGNLAIFPTPATAVYAND